MPTLAVFGKDGLFEARNAAENDSVNRNKLRSCLSKGAIADVEMQWIRLRIHKYSERGGTNYDVSTPPALSETAGTTPLSGFNLLKGSVSILLALCVMLAPEECPKQRYDEQLRVVIDQAETQSNVEVCDNPTIKFLTSFTSALLGSNHLMPQNFAKFFFRLLYITFIT